MGIIEKFDFGINAIIHEIKFFSRLPYRLECKLEELIIQMSDGMEGKLSDFEDMDIKNMEISSLKGFDMAKKMAINDFLLTNAVLEPKITEADLDDSEHELNDYFREIGDYLFDKYIAQYSEKSQVKKKVSKYPI